MDWTLDISLSDIATSTFWSATYAVMFKDTLQPGNLTWLQGDFHM